MLQQQEPLYFGYKNPGLHIKFKIIKSYRSCRQGCMYELMLLRQSFPGMDCYSVCCDLVFIYHSDARSAILAFEQGHFLGPTF